MDVPLLGANDMYENNIWHAFIRELDKRHSMKNKGWEWAPRSRAKEKQVARLARLYRKALMLSNRRDYLGNNFKCEVFYRDGKARPKLSGNGWRTI
jgi:hypothetical protein